MFAERIANGQSPFGNDWFARAGAGPRRRAAFGRIEEGYRRWSGGRRGLFGRGAFGIGSPFGPFGPLGPFGPFGAFRPRGAWKLAVAVAVAPAVARLVVERAAHRFGPGGPRPRPKGWRRFSSWGTGAQDERTDRAASRGRERHDRSENKEHHHGKEDKMPRFGRGFPGFEGPGHRSGRGDVKYVLLDLLREGPRHGYDMIKEIEKRSGGLYSPSPGSVYPTLQMLEDEGLVTSTTVEGKRTYRLTDTGYAFIEERSERTDDARGRAWMEGDHFREEVHSVGRDAADLARSLRNAVRAHTPDSRQMSEIRDVLGETRKRLESILAERRDATREGPAEHDKPTVV